MFDFVGALMRKVGTSVGGIFIIIGSVFGGTPTPDIEPPTIPSEVPEQVQESVQPPQAQEKKESSIPSISPAVKAESIDTQKDEEIRALREDLDELKKEQERISNYVDEKEAEEERVRKEQEEYEQAREKWWEALPLCEDITTGRCRLEGDRGCYYEKTKSGHLGGQCGDI